MASQQYTGEEKRMNKVENAVSYSSGVMTATKMLIVIVAIPLIWGLSAKATANSERIAILETQKESDLQVSANLKELTKQVATLSTSLTESMTEQKSIIEKIEELKKRFDKFESDTLRERKDYEDRLDKIKNRYYKELRDMKGTNPE